MRIIKGLKGAGLALLLLSGLDGPGPSELGEGGSSEACAITALLGYLHWTPASPGDPSRHTEPEPSFL